MSGESYSHIGQLSSDGRWRWDGASWRPVVPRALPHWLNRGLTRKATWLVLVAALAVGLVADQALRVGTFGLGASLTLALIALALVFAGRISSLEARTLAGAPVLFAARMGLVAPIARGALIAAPIATLVAVLLAAADPVFASFFNLNLDFNQLMLDVTFIAAGALVAARLFRGSAARTPFRAA